MKQQGRNGESGNRSYVLRSRVVPIVSPPPKRSSNIFKSRLLKEMMKKNPAEERKYYTLTPEELARKTMPYATEALDFYNQKWGKNYELVDPGDVSSFLIVRGCIHHMHFKAKDKDKPDAPVEMFFAELLSYSYMKRRVELCTNMGPLNLLPEKPMVHGCIKCYKNVIYHPATKGFRSGRKKENFVLPNDLK